MKKMTIEWMTFDEVEDRGHDGTSMGQCGGEYHFLSDGVLMCVNLGDEVEIDGHGQLDAFKITIKVEGVDV